MRELELMRTPLFIRTERPLIISKDCEIGAGTYLGPYTSTEDNVVVRGGEIENFMVLCQATANPTLAKAFTISRHESRGSFDNNFDLFPFRLSLQSLCFNLQVTFNCFPYVCKSLFSRFTL